MQLRQIEKSSSVSLLIALAENKCAPSATASSPGTSRLRTMVRLHDSTVKEAFERKRVDIRYAIGEKGYRRDRSKLLPDIPPAPPSFHPPTKRARTNGSNVEFVEFACNYSGANRSDDGLSEEDADERRPCAPECENNDETSETSREDARIALSEKKEDAHDNAALKQEESPKNIVLRYEETQMNEEETPNNTQLKQETQSDSFLRQDLSSGDNSNGKSTKEDKSEESYFSASDEESEEEALDDDDEEYEVPSDESVDDEFG